MAVRVVRGASCVLISTHRPCRCDVSEAENTHGDSKQASLNAFGLCYGNGLYRGGSGQKEVLTSRGAVLRVEVVLTWSFGVSGPAATHTVSVKPGWVTCSGTAVSVGLAGDDGPSGQRLSVRPAVHMPGGRVVSLFRTKTDPTLPEGVCVSVHGTGAGPGPDLDG